MEAEKINGIKRFRERMHIKTQGALADLLGVKQTTVSVWEINKGTPTTETMRKLLEMGATVEELFDIDYNEKHNLVKIEASPGGSIDIIQHILNRLEKLEGTKNIQKGIG